MSIVDEPMTSAALTSIDIGENMRRLLDWIGPGYIVSNKRIYPRTWAVNSIHV